MALRLLHRRRGKKTDPTEESGLLISPESVKSSKPRREDVGNRVPQTLQIEFLYVFKKVQALQAHFASSLVEIARGEGGDEEGRDAGAKQIMQLSFREGELRKVHLLQDQEDDDDIARVVRILRNRIVVIYPNFLYRFSLLSLRFPFNG